jgi:hypothetical protein
MYGKLDNMRGTLPLTAIVADGHRSTISAELLRTRHNDSTSFLRYGLVEYDRAVLPRYINTDSQSEHNTGKPTSNPVHLLSIMLRYSRTPAWPICWLTLYSCLRVR